MKSNRLVLILLSGKRGGRLPCALCTKTTYQTRQELIDHQGVCISCRWEKPTFKKPRRRSIPKETRAILRELPCSLCGIPADQIHHKDRNNKNNNPDNLIPVCLSCHCSLHFNDPVFRLMLKVYKDREKIAINPIS